MSSYALISHQIYANWFHQHEASLLYRTFFHQPAWLAVLEQTLPVQNLYLGVFEQGTLVAVLPGSLRQVGRFKFFGSPLRGTMTSYLGPVSLVAIQLEEMLKTGTQYLRKEAKVLSLDYILHPRHGSDELADFDQKSGWVLSSPDSYQLDLSAGRDALWRGLEKRSRNAIRKAEKLGVEIVPLRDAVLYYRILEQTFSHRGLSSYHPRQFFEALLTQLTAPDLLWGLGAKYQGEIIAAGLFAHDEREIHYLSGASLPAYHHIPASNFLQWAVIEQAVQAGLRQYDFGGRGIASIDHFKRSFGPEVIHYNGIRWAPGFVHKSLAVFSRLWPVWRRLRAQVTRL